MKVVSCKNGHFFDSDTYSVCPHCNAPIQDESEDKVVQEAKLGHGLLGIFRNKKKTADDPAKKLNSERRSEETANRTDKVINLNKNSSKSSGAKASAEKRPSEGNKTVELWDDADNLPNKEDKYDRTVVSSRLDSHEEDGYPTGSQKESLSDSIKKSSAIQDGKTLSYFESVRKANDDSSNISSEPMVGWLVCIKGKHFGESFNIYSGINTIGRLNSNRIVLAKEDSVSREKHAQITYEPKHRAFYLKPGDSSGLTYLNDDYIDESKMMHKGDIIEIGACKLMFVPLCDESFSWEDYIGKRS